MSFKHIIPLFQVTLSADDLLSCCKSCGFGCNGGDPYSAWKYWTKSGIVTGSNFTTNAGCKGQNPLFTMICMVASSASTKRPNFDPSFFWKNQGGGKVEPYPFPPCEHHSNKTHYDPCRHDLFPTPKCEKKCVPTYKDKSYDADKYYGVSGERFMKI
ncbi:papain family cysteine protease [Ancylostoma caninum]|uniref:Papain family cysteine protease n=1 Tax=Ancylostoma caninum TaxID=29170 RepID=A0A368F052_ANCCA|nr:papain family cysteine protease [Ancylostoma caninum]